MKAYCNVHILSLIPKVTEVLLQPLINLFNIVKI